MNNNEQKTNTEHNIWFYEKSGQRIGGISEDEIIKLIQSGEISHGSPIWKSGFPDWMKIENTELRAHLETIVPPPLVGEHVNNTVVWMLAFAPIIGVLLQYFIGGMVHADNEYLAEKSVTDGDYWYITVFLNVGLCVWDAKRLKQAGTNTNNFRGWRWIVPVYLFQRAKALNHDKSYFIVWVASFVLSLMAFQ